MGMARVPILHDVLVLLRGEAEHLSRRWRRWSSSVRRSGGSAMSSASSKLRRVRLFISARERPSLHAATSYAGAAKYSWQNLPRHTRSLFAQLITAMNVPSERLRTPWKLGGRRRGGMVAVARRGKECTRRELVATGFAWRPSRPFTSHD